MRFVIFFAFLATPMLSAAQQIPPETPALGKVQTLGQFLSNSPVPLSIKAVDLPGNYHAVQVTVAAGSDLLSPTTFSAIMFSSRPLRNQEYLVATSYWTAGQNVFLDDALYLVTYKAEARFIEPKSDSNRNASFTGRMVATLIRRESIAAITPISDLTREELVSELSAQNPQANMADARATTISNLKQVALGTQMYLNDYDDVLPYVQNTATIQRVTEPYLRSRETWRTLNPNGGRFLFNMALAGVNTTELREPAEEPLYYEEKPWPDGSRAVAFADGHVKFVPSSDWIPMRRQLTKKYKRSGRPLPVQQGWR